MKWLLGIRPVAFDLYLLILRLAGGLMILHGTPKLMNFATRMDDFSDPLGIGSVASLALCIFAEFFCTVFIVVGAFTRLALIPLLINMLVAVFIVHGGDPVSDRELGIFYLLVYLALFFSGPGKYSVDGLRKA